MGRLLGSRAGRLTGPAGAARLAGYPTMPAVRIAATGSVVGQASTPFGPRYVVDGILTAPSGATANLRTIWIVESGKKKPRFVTAYPRRRWKGTQ